jgi:hypothetical protein
VFEAHGTVPFHVDSTVLHAGKLITFVYIRQQGRAAGEEEGEEGPSAVMLALVHKYRSVNGGVNRGNVCFDIESPRARHKQLFFPHMRLNTTADGGADVELIDSECISSGIWAEQDWDEPTATWFIRHNNTPLTFDDVLR